MNGSDFLYNGESESDFLDNGQSKSDFVDKEEKLRVIFFRTERESDSVDI